MRNHKKSFSLTSCTLYTCVLSFLCLFNWPLDSLLPLHNKLVIRVLNFIFMIDFGFVSSGISLHSSHSLLPSFLHFIDWTEKCFLLLMINVWLILLEVSEYFLFVIAEFFFELFHFLFHSSILAQWDMIQHVKVVLVYWQRIKNGI